MAKVAGLPLLVSVAAGLLTAAPAIADPPAAGSPLATAAIGTRAAPQPEAVCSGSGGARRCTVSAVQGFANNRGSLSEVNLSLVRDARCTTLHIVFDGPIALDRPVTLTAEGAAPQTFYTAAALTDLARALDEGGLDERAPPEFRDFLRQVAEGAFTGAGRGAEPGAAMIQRFAAIKEPRRIGMTCAPMERLLPLIRSGTRLRLEFQVEPRAVTQLYHWPRLDSRAVDFRLDALVDTLDRAMPGS